MSRNVTDYSKHGYFVGLEDIGLMDKFVIFCKRRSSDVVKDKSSKLTYDELIAAIYMQGLQDGLAIAGDKRANFLDA